MRQHIVAGPPESPECSTEAFLRCYAGPLPSFDVFGLKEHLVSYDLQRKKRFAPSRRSLVIRYFL